MSLTEEKLPQCPNHDMADCAPNFSSASKDSDNLLTVTLRSILVGTLMSIFSSASAQIFILKPVTLQVRSLFIQISCFIIGKLAAQIPGPKTWNPGPFSIRETTFSSIMACSAGAGAMSIEMIGARSLLFNQSPSPVISLMIMLSSQMIGYGWAGLLAPLIVNSPRIVFPSVLPSVTLFNSLYANSDQSKDQVSFFKKVFLGISFYEIFPLYIAPALQAISPWCLALPKTPEISHVFGGSRVGEGLGFLSLSLEWSIIGSEGPLYTPIESQCNQIFAHVVAIFLFSSAYKLNWFDGGSLPFISFELLDNNGNAYKTSAVINPDGTENVQAVEELGLPRFSTSYIIGKAFICLALSAAFSTAVMQNFSGLKIMLFDKKKSQVPIKKKLDGLKEFPMWGFYSLLFCSIGLAFAASNISQSGLSNWGLLVAIMVSFLLSLASGFFYGTTGIRLHTSPVVQVLGGLFFPGNAVGTMWFTTYGASTASQSTLMLKELKLGKYMHIPSFKAVIGQLAGTVIGVFVDFLVFKSILNSKREALLSPEGNGIFSGMHLTSFEAQSITWGIFGKQLYGAGKIYFFVPCFLLAGLFLPIPIEIFRRKRPNFFLSKIDVAMIAGTFYKSIQGVTSGATIRLLLGVWSQFYMKNYHSRWYKKHNYMLSAALDGGTQLMILILTFTLQGGTGWNVTFPSWFMNPSDGPRDYCYDTRIKHKTS